MGAPEPAGRRQAGAQPHVARVVPDVVGLSRRFDYLIPEHLLAQVRVGTVVRVPLHGRRVRGWVVDVADQAETDRPLLPLAKVSGWGPSAELVSLADWAAWRWAGHPTHFLNTASPLRAVHGLPPAPPERRVNQPNEPSSLAAQAFERPLSVMRLPPAGDPFPFVLAAASRGDALVLCPSLADAASVASRLREAGCDVALMPRDWARAAAGGCAVVGARSAAWAPVPRLRAAVVLDEHDEGHQEERAPTWNGRDVVIERARRAGVPCALLSPCPSLATLATVAGADVLIPDRGGERRGWPVIEVVDRRNEPPGLGLYSERLVHAVRQAGAGAPMVCVLNRKGRARLLACVGCGELARCATCDGPLETAAEGLQCRRCGGTQPLICRFCGTSRMKVLRVGVTRAREELELLAGQPVGEVTADEAGTPLPRTAVLVGTEAVLHRITRAATVAFLDFDQELLASRYRAAEQAFALLARAARLVGVRGAGRVIVQTRLPTHEVLDAAVHADPGRLTLVEAARRAALRLPPETALARISGAAAHELAAGLREQTGLEILGPSGDRWLVRADDHRRLCDGLAAVRRPAGRVRVEVDPLRA